MDLYRAGNYEAAVAAGEAEGSGEAWRLPRARFSPTPIFAMFRA